MRTDLTQEQGSFGQRCAVSSSRIHAHVWICVSETHTEENFDFIVQRKCSSDKVRVIPQCSLGTACDAAGVHCQHQRLCKHPDVRRTLSSKHIVDSEEGHVWCTKELVVPPGGSGSSGSVIPFDPHSTVHRAGTSALALTPQSICATISGMIWLSLYASIEPFKKLLPKPVADVPRSNADMPRLHVCARWRPPGYLEYTT